jgi:mono/diheme cytochrome c family protein
MKKAFKWIGIVLGSLVGLILILAAVFYFIGNARLNKTYDFSSDNIVVPTDAASVEYGKHRVRSMCIGCHGDDLSGVDNFVNIGPIMTLDSANLTSGQGGVGQEYTTGQDYVRAIRHGVDPDGKPNFMPAVSSFQYLSDEDLGAIIAYLKTLPPVDHETSGLQVKPLGKILIGAGMFGNLPVEDASHKTNVTAPAAGITTEYGEYLVNINGCRDCHGKELAGGPFPDPSVTVISPNLTPGGELAAWSEEDFLTAIRTGNTPSGHALKPELMPWKEISGQSDDELKAIWLYLQSLPKLAQYTE